MKEFEFSALSFVAIIMIILMLIAFSLTLGYMFAEFLVRSL